MQVGISTFSRKILKPYLLLVTKKIINTKISVFVTLFTFVFFPDRRDFFCLLGPALFVREFMPSKASDAAICNEVTKRFFFS